MHRTLNAFADSFSPLRVRNLRIYLSGQAVSLIGTWMQMTAMSWVVWQLSHSEAALGIVNALGSLPLLLLGPWAGVWADRLDRRRVLLVTESVAMTMAFTLAALVQTGHIQLWHVYLLAALLGVVNALDLPAQQAFIGDLSGLDQVRKAVVVNAMTNQLSRMLGPAIAGWVIGALGLAPAFWLNGTSFVAVLATLMAVHGNQTPKPFSGNPLTEFREGLRFIGRQPRIQDLLFFTGLAVFFGIAAHMQLMPPFATDILHRGPETLGLLLGSTGLGSIVSSLFAVPILLRLRYTGRMLAIVLLFVGIFYVIFSFSRWLPLSLLCLFCTGAGIPVVMTTSNGLLQTLAPPDMRARLLSTWLMVGFGLQPLAALLVGVSARFLGAPLVMRACGLLMASLALLWLASRPALRHWEAGLRARVAP